MDGYMGCKVDVRSTVFLSKPFLSSLPFLFFLPPGGSRRGVTRRDETRRVIFKHNGVQVDRWYDIHDLEGALREEEPSRER